MRRISKYLVFLLSALMVIGFSACGKANNEVKNNNNSSVENSGQVQNNTNEANSEEDKNETKELTVKLYFSDDQAMYLVGEDRTLTNPTIKDVVEELLKGPTSQNLIGAIPEGAEVINVEVENRIASVNFTKKFSEDLLGGSAGEAMALYSIVDTLTLNKELNVDKVQILIEGEKVNSLAGHMDISEPLEANLELISQ